MTDATAQSVAQELAARHRAREQFTLEMPRGRERDLGFAYAVQASLLPLITPPGVRRAGYKIGVTTPRMQKMCGISEPVAGVVLAHRLHTSPATTRAADHARLGVESEMALRIGRPLPTDPAALSIDAVADCVAEACAAFELIDDSNSDYKRLSGATLIADNGWNAGLVLGPPQSLRGRRSLAGIACKLHLNGAFVDTGTSSDVLGDPLNAIVWLQRHLLGQKRTLEVGEWITTGSIIPTQFAKAGETFLFEIEGFAPVQVSVT